MAGPQSTSLPKHAWIEFEAHTGIMKMLANKPPDQYCLYCAGDTAKYATIAHHADLNMAAGRGLEWWWKPSETGLADAYGLNKGTQLLNSLRCDQLHHYGVVG